MHGIPIFTGSPSRLPRRFQSVELSLRVAFWRRLVLSLGLPSTNWVWRLFFRVLRTIYFVFFGEVLSPTKLFLAMFFFSVLEGMSNPTSFLGGH